MQSDRDALIEAAAARTRPRHRWRQDQAVARRTQAQQFARQAAEHLAAADARVQKIIGFGSTFETWRNYRLDSDIDLAVIGGDQSALTRAIPESEFDVSIVNLDTKNEEFCDYVLERGEVLYESRS